MSLVFDMKDLIKQNQIWWLSNGKTFKQSLKVKMKSFIPILFVFKLVSCDSDEVVVAKVFTDSIQELYVENELTFDVIMVGKVSPHIEEVLVGFMNDNFTQKVIRIKDKSLDLHQSAIILSKSIKSAAKFLVYSKLKNIFPKKLKFLIYVENFQLEVPELPIIWNFTHLWHFSYFLINTEREIIFASIEWFADLCDVQQIEIQNSFDKKLKSWKENFKIREKFRDFHKCPLVFQIAHFGNSYHTQYEVKTFKPFGLLADISLEVSRRGNATAVLQLEKRGIKEKNTNPLQNMKSHVIVGSKATFVMREPNSRAHITSTFAETSFVFAITPGEDYSSYEKLLLPFDWETWLYLILTFASAFLVIFIVNRTPKSIRETFYGKNVKNAAFEVVGGFFGIPQNFLPVENFPRILIMFFVMFCLIIRVAYQGEMILS